MRAACKLSQKLGKWGLFSDLHLQLSGLTRIDETARWITETFRSERVSQVICLGDVLNTRETVAVQPLSSVAQLFGELKKVAPVHVVLGNHDMNLKHEGRISSLDFLELVDGVKVYRNIEQVEIEGIKCLMIPWHESHSSVVEYLQGIHPSDRRKTSVFGHLALSGAIHNMRLETWMRSKYHEGPLSPSHFENFRNVFLGHFHRHHNVGNGNVWYVGAPMQHHFGDSGDEGRGIVLYDAGGMSTGPKSFKFLQNPEWETYRAVDASELLEQKKKGTLAKINPQGKLFQISCRGSETVKFPELQRELLSLGAVDVRQKISFRHAMHTKLEYSQPGPEKVLSGIQPPSTQVEAEDEVQSPTIQDALSQFMEFIPDRQKFFPDADLPKYLDLGRSLIAEASDANAENALPRFSANISRLEITNFLSVQGTLTLPFNKFNPGIWYIVGENGSGKSLILEAITWALFGKLLRAGAPSDGVVNTTVGKNCAVKIEFENGYAVERLRKFPTRGAKTVALKVYKDGKPLGAFERGEIYQSQRALERDILGCNFELFSKCVVFGDEGKGAGNFMALERSQRRELLEKVLNIDVLDVPFQKCREQSKALEERVELARRGLHDLENQQKATRQKKSQLQKEIVIKEKEKVAIEKAISIIEKEKEELEGRRERSGGLQENLLQLRVHYDKAMAIQSQIHSIESELEISKGILERRKGTLDLIKLLDEERYVCAQLKASKKNLQCLNMGVNTLREELEELSTIRSTYTAFRIFALGYLKAAIGLVKKTIDVLGISTPQSLRTAVSYANSYESLKARLSAKNAEFEENEMKVQSINQQIENMERDLESVRSKAQSLRSAYRIGGDCVDALIFSFRIRPSSYYYELLGFHQNRLSESLQGGSIEELRNKMARLQSQIEADPSSRIQRKLDELTTRQISYNQCFGAADEGLKILAENLKARDEDLRGIEASFPHFEDNLQRLQESLVLYKFWENCLERNAKKDYPNFREWLLKDSIKHLNQLIAEKFCLLKGNGDDMADPSGKESIETATPTSKRKSNRKSKINTTVDGAIFSIENVQFSPTLDLPSHVSLLSSGQAKRLSLSILISLFQLVLHTSRLRPGFFFFDEAFDALDIQGRRDSLILLEEVMRAEGIRWAGVISHTVQAENVEKGSGVLEVSRGKRGTRIVDSDGVVEYVRGKA